MGSPFLIFEFWDVALFPLIPHRKLARVGLRSLHSSRTLEIRRKSSLELSMLSMECKQSYCKLNPHARFTCSLSLRNNAPEQDKVYTSSTNCKSSFFLRRSYCSVGHYDQHNLAFTCIWSSNFDQLLSGAESADFHLQLF